MSEKEEAQDSEIEGYTYSQGTVTSPMHNQFLHLKQLKAQENVTKNH